VNPEEALRWLDFAKRVIQRTHPEWHLSDDDDGLVWLAVNDCIRTYDPDAGATFQTWLAGRVCYRMIDQRRASRDWAWTRPGRVKVLPIETTDGTVYDTPLADLADLLDRLPVKHRDAVVAPLHGYRYADVAAKYGVSESMVCKWRRRGLEHLRRELEEAA
jgi:RNA polymerase sigma factor (sigma-70 family)